MKKKFIFYLLLLFALSIASCGTRKSMLHKPQLQEYTNTIPIVEKSSNTVFTSANNFLVKNKQDLWELYIEGDPLERGLVAGALTDSLLKKQERIFFSKINTLVPSKTKQSFLRTFLKWYNRKLYLNVTNEYQSEIYGISEYSSADFDNIAPRYLRNLYLHGVHDIGHALNDLALVGCSSFAAWGDKSEDGSLILGRNFDFYFDDEFAKDKVVEFVSPNDGYQFMMVTWPGMIGVVSGMNIEGLTATINAGKSKIPLIARTPITLLTREILQYATTIEEAIAIAKKRKVFVSESIMIGSAKDNKAIIIEVAPDNFGVFEVPNSNDQVLCSNHFQSDAFKDDKRNQAQIENSHSKYRFDKLIELFDQNPKINPQIAASILRNTEGLAGLEIGFGNEKALNQMIAHHAIIFKPEQKLVWVSSNPAQMGEFVCYDLNKVFKNRNDNPSLISIQEEELNIPKDIFLESEAYKNYELFKIEDRKIDDFIKNKTDLPAHFAKNYQSLNTDLWSVYYKVGVLLFQQNEYKLAKIQFEMALTKEITTVPNKMEIEDYLKKIKRKLR